MPAKKVSTFNSDGTNQRATVIVGLGFRGSDGELYVVDGDQTTGGINVNSTFVPSGTQDVNLTKIAGTAVEAGQGASSAGSQRVVANLSVSSAAVTLANPVAVTPGTGATFQSAQSGVWSQRLQDGSGNAISSSVTTLGRSIFAQGLVAGIEANAGTVEYTNSTSNSISTFPGAYNAGGSITTSGDVVTLTAAVITLNPGIVGITVKSGSGGIMQPEISTDGTTWYSVRVYRIDGTPGSVSTITANGVYQANIAGVRYFRINCTSTPSVAYVVNIRSSPSAFSNNTEITGTVPLPTGAATETTLSSLNGKVTAVNTGAVVISSSALPSGASTSALQTTGNTSVASIDTKTVQWSLGAGTVATAPRTLSIPGNVSGIADFGAGATGVQTQRVEANVALAGVAAATGTGASGTGTQRVQLANESLPGVGSAAVQLVSATQRSYIIDMASTNMTTAYLQIIASTPGVINSIEVFNGSGEPMFFATGAAASEVSQYVIPPGGTTGFVKIAISASSRIAVKSFANTVNSGYFILNTLS